MANKSGCEVNRHQIEERAKEEQGSDDERLPIFVCTIEQPSPDDAHNDNDWVGKGDANKNYLPN